MKLKLNNNAEIDILCAEGGRIEHQGEYRNTLRFCLPKKDRSFDQLEELFGNPENTQKLIISDEGGEYLHEHYTLRVSMEVSIVEISLETAEAPAEFEERIFILLAQKSYRERELEEMKRMLAKLTERAK